MSSGIVSATNLAQILVGTGAGVSNAQFSGAGVAGGSFSGGEMLGIASGVVLSTGQIAGVVGPNTVGSRSTNHGQPGDAALTTLAGGPTFDRAALDFDFIPASPSASFRFVFGSEEYNEFVGQGYNDAFAVFVNGANCAVLPGGAPVSVDSVNLGANAGQFIDNTGGAVNTEFDGFTRVLGCSAPVTPGVANHVRVVIADTGDAIVDSGVFIASSGVVATERLGSNPAEADNQCDTSRPVNCATGNFWHTFTDLDIPGRGPGLALTRTYNAFDAGTDGPFGYGWASTYTMSAMTDPNGVVTIC